MSREPQTTEDYETSVPLEVGKLVFELNRVSRARKMGAIRRRRIPFRKFPQLWQFFQLAAIFQRRDEARARARESSMKADCARLRVCWTPLFCDSDVLTTLYRYIGKVKRHYESGLSSSRAQTSLFRENPRGPFFSSTISFMSLMGCIVYVISRPDEMRQMRLAISVTAISVRLPIWSHRWFTSPERSPRKLKSRG